MGSRTANITVIAMLLVAMPLGAWAACRDTVVDLRGDWGAARFTVDVADDAAERAQGLMNVPQMPASKGMLFVYEQPQTASFWMRNTLIPLDMIFMDPTGTVTRVHENAVPLDETAIPGGDNVLLVLEINGGLAGRLGIVPGSQLRHPLVPQNGAAWPCDAS